MKVEDYFNKDGSPIKCPKCNSINITEKIISMIDVYQGMGPISEAEYYCECGECVGFWSYGSWYPDAKRNFEMINNKEENVG